jgi:hypothetical protein
MKRETGSSSGERKETARDLSSFAVDGGALLVGIEEDKENRTWRLRPQPLEGLAEKLEQIATQLVDPPLFITADEIPAEADASTGYLFVQVPRSARAPHMVEGIYYGRGDRTRIRLSDAEVVRHHASRESLESLVTRMLDEEIARDPVPAAEQKTGRLYVVAQPLTALRDIALEFVRGDDLEFYHLINGAEASLPGSVREFAPGPDYANHSATRAHGRARCSSGVTGPGRTFEQSSPHTDEEDLLDIELREDGGIRVLMGRMTPEWPRGGQTSRVIADGLAVAYALRVARWAEALGHKCGYSGSWVFGMAATGLRGLQSSAYGSGAFNYRQGPAYDVDSYRESTTATTLELKQQPWAVADRVVGRLLRGLATTSRYGPALGDPSSAG